MDFMEMREALKAGACLAANRNEKSFYGARPDAASRDIATAAATETISRHAASDVRAGCDPRFATGGKRDPI